MIDIGQEAFEAMVADAIAAIPEPVQRKLEPVVFLVEDEPSEHQRETLELGDDDLLGLFEGYTRGEEAVAGSRLPPTITLFRLPILWECETEDDARREIADTLWHEVAHYLGLDEADVRHEESKGHP